jgi:cell volume regulation protein A
VSNRLPPLANKTIADHDEGQEHIVEIAILAAGLFIFVAHLLDYIFQKTRIPDILLLMLIGVFMGPVFEVVDPTALGEVGNFLSIVTLVVLLCASGLSLKFQVLVRAARRATPFALVSMIGAIALMSWMLHALLGLDMWMAILGGFILGGTSSAVVIPMITSLNASEDITTILTVESALTDVLCIIGTVGIAASLAEGGGVQPTMLLGSVMVSLLCSTLLGIVTGLFWAYIISIAERMKGAMHTTMAYALLIYGAAEIMQISGAITVLAFAVTLGNLPSDLSVNVGKRKISFKPVSDTEKAVYSEVVFLLKAFFFFYLGLQVAPTEFFTTKGLVALLLALAPFIPRLPAVRWILDRKRTNRREALLSWALVPRGLAAAVLAQIPIQGAVTLLGTADEAHLLPALIQHQQAFVLAETIAMAVFLSITAVAIVVLLTEQGKLDGFGKTMFGAFPDLLEPDQGPDTEEQGPDTEEQGPDTEEQGPDEGSPAPNLTAAQTAQNTVDDTAGGHPLAASTAVTPDEPVETTVSRAETSEPLPRPTEGLEASALPVPAVTDKPASTPQPGRQTLTKDGDSTDTPESSG